MRTKALAIAHAHSTPPSGHPAPHARSLGASLSNQLRLRALGVQPKLQVSSPDDAYEREADSVADKVMRMPAATSQPLPVSRVGTSAQRKCAECEEEETLQRKETTAAPPGRVPLDPVPGIGAPLAPSLRGFFEPRFGRDFSDVRVHTGGQAAAVASSLRARAFTYGRDIVFGAGEYAPETTAGRRVLAHELTHVAQQGRGPSMVQRLGANPGCTDAEAAVVRQSIFDARGWLNKAVRKMETTPTPSAVLRSLRRNFGPTYGVAANIALIVGRLRRGYRELSTIPIGCAGAADATCATNPCGYAVAGGHEATVCSNVTLPPASTDTVYQAGCVLHESLHAAFTNFTVDEYSGWHGHSGSTPTYPGAGTDPLLNADSYTTLTMDLS